MEQHCFPAGLDGQGLAYGVNIKVRGLTPSAPFTLKLDEFDIGTGEWRGSIGPAEFPANPEGRFGPFGYGVVGIPTRYTLTMVYAGQTFRRTATSTCDPILIRQCRGNNWKASSRFESRADCRAFVRAHNATT
jgi:hypothetical protein